MTKGGQPNNKIGIFLVGLAANDIFQKMFADNIAWMVSYDLIFSQRGEEKVVLCVPHFTLRLAKIS